MPTPLILVIKFATNLSAISLTTFVVNLCQDRVYRVWQRYDVRNPRIPWVRGHSKTVITESNSGIYDLTVVCNTFSLSLEVSLLH